jgi:hypothetical protein
LTLYLGIANKVYWSTKICVYKLDSRGDGDAAWRGASRWIWGFILENEDCRCVWQRKNIHQEIGIDGIQKEEVPSHSI